LLQKQSSVRTDGEELENRMESLTVGSESSSSSTSGTEPDTTPSTNHKSLDMSRQRKSSAKEIKLQYQYLQCRERTDGPIGSARTSRPRIYSHPNFSPRTSTALLLHPDKIVHTGPHSTLRFSLPGYFRRFSQVPSS